MGYNPAWRESVEWVDERKSPLPVVEDRLDAEQLGGARALNVQRVQAWVLYESLLAETRGTLNDEISYLRSRSGATSDSFIRHHLRSVAREIFEIEKAFNARFSTEVSSQNLADALKAEMALFESIFEGRVRPIDNHHSRSEIVASWITIQLFRSLFHEVIEQTLRSTDRTVTIYIRLRQYGRILCIEINNIEFRMRRELAAYFNSQSRIREKISALDARIESNDNSLSTSHSVESLFPSFERAPAEHN